MPPLFLTQARLKCQSEVHDAILPTTKVTLAADANSLRPARYYDGPTERYSQL